MSLAKALLAFQTDAPALQKNAINPHFRNRYISLDSLMEQVLPMLNKHGIALLQSPTVTEGQPALRTKLVHAESGDAVEDTMLLEVAKHDPQGQGSAITYARRYSLMAMLGLVADEDDDGNSSSKTGGSSSSPQAAQPAAGAASSHPQAGSAAPAFNPPDSLGLKESRADNVPVSQTVAEATGATDKQKALIRRLAKKLNVPSLPDLDSLGKRDASALIEQLKAKEAEDEGLPF